MSDILRKEIVSIAEAAKDASNTLALTSDEARNSALNAMAAALLENSDSIIAANVADMNAAREAGTSEALLDRLMINETRLAEMADALRDLATQPDPLGKIQLESTMYNGMQLKRVSVPLGVVAMVFEARPNVCADAAGICIKSGNACILRGGSMAANTNSAIANALSAACEKAGLPRASVSAIETTDRAATDVLMSLHGLVDVLIPRGGAGLIAHCVENSKVPVIETGTGNCHVYIEQTADTHMAHDIVMNAKCRRYGVCNAAETLLVDEALANKALPPIMNSLAEKGVTMHVDEYAKLIAREAGIDASKIESATEEDWATEYLAPEIAIKVVHDYKEAVNHINKYGTKHSESIVTQNEQAAEYFTRGVDASAVYVNASTAFTDGGQFGLGAEIGISTQKLHARGPFAIDALTSYKYVLRGSGQTRG